MPKTAANARAAKPKAVDTTPSTSGKVSPAPSAPRDPNRGPSKSERVVEALRTNEGVTIAELCKMTGWQPHSCRAFFTGLRKKGQPVACSKGPDGATVYRLATAEGAAE